MMEVLIAFILLTVMTTVIFFLVRETDRIDIESKRIHFAETLINPYIAYYQNTDVKKSDVSIYLSDVQTVDLVKEYRNSGGIVPSTLVDTKVLCENSPEEVAGYVVFDIRCEVNGKEINKGRSYVIKKYID